MKIFHIADVHLGLSHGGFAERAEDMRRALRGCAEICAEIEPDLAIVAGDIFDKHGGTPSDVVCIADFFKTCGAGELCVVSGNHDFDMGGPGWPQAIESVSGIRIIPSNLQPGDEPPVIAGKRVLAYDWMDRGSLAELLSSLGQGACDILVLHQSMREALPELAQYEMELGQLEGIASSYVALGDIHLRSEFEIGGAVVAYPGPTHWCRAGEADRCFASVVTIPPGGGKATVEAVEIPGVRPRVSVSIEDPDFASKAADAAAAGIPPFITLLYPPNLEGRVPDAREALMSAIPPVSGVGPIVCPSRVAPQKVDVEGGVVPAGDPDFGMVQAIGAYSEAKGLPPEVTRAALSLWSGDSIEGTIKTLIS